MSVISQKTSRQFQIRYTLIFMLIFNKSFSQSSTSMLSSLRYLQSKLMTHEELNRVRSIFRDCCSILLNCKKVTRYWRDEKLQSNKISVSIDQQDSQQDSQLLTNNRASINIHCFRICFDKRSLASTLIERSSKKKSVNRFETKLKKNEE